MHCWRMRFDRLRGKKQVLFISWWLDIDAKMKQVKITSISFGGHLDICKKFSACHDHCTTMVSRCSSLLDSFSSSSCPHNMIYNVLPWAFIPEARQVATAVSMLWFARLGGIAHVMDTLWLGDHFHLLQRSTRHLDEVVGMSRLLYDCGV